jgi:WD40 repeat protein
MLERKKIINRYLNEFIPNVLSNLISEYDYCFIGESKPILENPNGYAYCCAILSDYQKSRLVTKSHGHSIGIWNMQTEICELSLAGDTSDIVNCFILSDGRIATRSRYNTLKLWNSKTGKCDITFENDPICCCTSLTNELLVTGSIFGTLKIWSVQKQTKKCELSIVAHHGWITHLHCIAFPDGLIVSAADELKVWSVYRTITGELSVK